MLGPFFPGKACRLLVRKEKRVLNIEASFYGKSALLSYAKKVAKNPGGSARLKNMNSNANNWRIHIFSYGSLRFPPGPSLRPKSRACARLASARACGRRTANEVAFSVARETARMTFARSHAARVPENGIWNRAANRATAVAGEIISAQRPFRTHAVRNAGLCAGLKPHRARRDSQYHFSMHP